MLDAAPGLEPIAESARKVGLNILDAARPPEDVRIVQGRWPGVRSGQNEGSASAGPTGAPWVDSNAWLVRLEQARNPGKTVWILTDTPAESEIHDARSYLAGLADAACCGGRWILPVDTRLGTGLADGAAEARQTWDRLASAMRFFDDHREWASWRPRAVFGVLSDFAGPNEDLAQEILNLAGRQSLSFRVLDKTKAGAAGLGGLKAVIYPDATPPEAPLRKELLAFVAGGGLLVTGPSSGWNAGSPEDSRDFPGHQLYALGKGRIAVWKATEPDPYDVAADTRLLLSRRQDLLRLWNAGSLMTHLVEAPDGRALVHAIDFAARRAPDLTSLWVAGRYRTARMWDFEQSGARELRTFPNREGVEIHLPPIPVYAAMEFLP